MVIYKKLKVRKIPMLRKIKEKLWNKKFIKEFVAINIGVFLTAFAFSVFLDSNNIVIGGVGGIGIILRETLTLKVPTSAIIFGLNMILLILGLIFLGKEFFLKTAYGSLVYPLYTFLSELIYKRLLHGEAADEKHFLIIIIFASAITGLGLGLSIRNGGSTGGTDILQNIFLKYFKMPLSVSLVILDGIVVVIGGLVFKDFNYVLYGILFIIISGYVLDNVVFGGFNVRAVHIISKNHDEIKKCVITTFNRTVTEIYARGGYSGEDTKMLICILSTNEYYRLRAIIQEVDDTAFVYVTKATEVHGEGFTYEKQ